MAKRIRQSVAEAAGSVISAASAYKDGVAVSIEIDLDQIAELILLARQGKLKGKRSLPGRLLIDPSYVAPQKG